MMDRFMISSSEFEYSEPFELALVPSLETSKQSAAHTASELEFRLSDEIGGDDGKAIRPSPETGNEAKPSACPTGARELAGQASAKHGFLALGLAR